MIMHGSISLLANTIAAHQMIAQDLLDTINGENIYVGTGSLKNLFRKLCRVPYGTGARNIYQSTNTAQTATSIALTLDYYESGNKVGDCMGTELDRFAIDTVEVPQVCAIDVALTWVGNGFVPASPIPNGKYALLGFILANATQPHAIRFAHADFGFCLPGIPTMDNSLTIGTKEVLDVISQNPGYQFVALSEATKKPCIPVFTVSNAATGLQIQTLAAAAVDTVTVTPYITKVG